MKEALDKSVLIPDAVSSENTELQTAYAGSIQEVLADLYLEDGVQNWNEQVSDVTVVLCASRSGSSLIFNALSTTGKVAAPAGEHEPWLTMTGNKFPFLDSDAMNGQIQEKNLLLKLLRNDLLVRDRQLDAARALIPLRNRLVVRRQQDVDGFAEQMSNIAGRKNILHTEWPHILRGLGSLAIKPIPTSVAKFDDPGYRLPLENPPLIDQPLAHIATDDEIAKLPLLFKSPSDAYRPQMYEELFPNARVNYIHLTRGFVQTTNGLMDGWQKDEIDFISNPVGVQKPLDIEEYSITDISKTYWCFDLFEEWKEYTQKPLIEVAAKQWLQAHTSILEDFNPDSQLTFEEFYTDPASFYTRLTDVTGINTQGYDWSKSVMSTETPSQKRWLKRANTFRNLGSYLPGAMLKDIIEVQNSLGYRMDEESWH